jgi:AcrR family transcriptional regulator
MTETARRGRGRPRDGSIDERALAATRDLLARRGFEGTTIQAVAHQSGLHASAIYRRWPSRVELIEDAVSPGVEAVQVTPTGDLRRDLERFVRAYLRVLSTPAARAAAAPLMALHQSAGGRGPAGIRHSTRPQFRAILAAAPAGTVDAAIDPDDVFDVVLGLVLTRILVDPVISRRRPVSHSVDMVLRLLRPLPTA